MSISKMAGFFMILALLFCVVPAFAQQGPSVPPDCYVYGIKAEGQVGNQYGYNEFTISGNLVVWVTKIEFSNQAEHMWMQLGNPLTNPSSGALFFTSNGYFAPGYIDAWTSGVVELATVELEELRNGFHYSMEVNDDFATNQAGMINVANYSSGLLAEAKILQSGILDAYFSEDAMEVSGGVSALIRSWSTLESQASIEYYAEFTGEVLGYAYGEDCLSVSR